MITPKKVSINTLWFEKGGIFVIVVFKEVLLTLLVPTKADDCMGFDAAVHFAQRHIEPIETAAQILPTDVDQVFSIFRFR